MGSQKSRSPHAGFAMSYILGSLFVAAIMLTLLGFAIATLTRAYNYTRATNTTYKALEMASVLLARQARDHSAVGVWMDFYSDPTATAEPVTLWGIELNGGVAGNNIGSAPGSFRDAWGQGFIMYHNKAPDSSTAGAGDLTAVVLLSTGENKRLDSNGAALLLGQKPAGDDMIRTLTFRDIRNIYLLALLVERGEGACGDAETLWYDTVDKKYQCGATLLNVSDPGSMSGVSIISSVTTDDSTGRRDVVLKALNPLDAIIQNAIIQINAVDDAVYIGLNCPGGQSPVYRSASGWGCAVVTVSSGMPVCGEGQIYLYDNGWNCADDQPSFLIAKPPAAFPFPTCQNVSESEVGLGPVPDNGDAWAGVNETYSETASAPFQYLYFDDAAIPPAWTCRRIRNPGVYSGLPGVGNGGEQGGVTPNQENGCYVVRAAAETGGRSATAMCREGDYVVSCGGFPHANINNTAVDLRFLTLGSPRHTHMITPVKSNQGDAGGCYAASMAQQYDSNDYGISAIAICCARYQ